MKDISYFSGTAESGVLKLRYKQSWIDFLNFNDGKQIELYASALTGRRTPKQNALLWAAILQAIAIHTGHSKNEIHEFMEEKFAERKPLTLGKETQFVKATCSTLKKNEFSELIEVVKKWAREELDMIFE